MLESNLDDVVIDYDKEDCSIVDDNGFTPLYFTCKN